MFEYIQTWLVKEGFDEAHDKLLDAWILEIKGSMYLREVRFFKPLQVLPRKCVLVYLFDNVDNWRKFREGSIGGLRLFVKSWLPIIEKRSYKIFFLE